MHSCSVAQDDFIVELSRQRACEKDCGKEKRKKVKLLHLAVDEDYLPASPQDFGRNDTDDLEVKPSSPEVSDYDSQLLKVLLNIW
mmetsp:Transcript_13426/g.30929  ORF Transcript_13426/g.30929 Transcript_13426/m.30929 type:complete len:85 (+) Transcript_13426:168-422(+)